VVISAIIPAIAPIVIAVSIVVPVLASSIIAEAVIVPAIVVVIPVVAIPILEYPNLFEAVVIAVEVEAAAAIEVDHHQTSVTMLFPVPTVATFDRELPRVGPVHFASPRARVVAIIAIVGIPDSDSSSHRPPSDMDVRRHSLRLSPLWHHCHRERGESEPDSLPVDHFVPTFL
jgi:hypothetical protein